jgi:hypothetical protein
LRISKSGKTIVLVSRACLSFLKSQLEQALTRLLNWTTRVLT